VSERTSRQDHRFDAFRLCASHGEIAGTLSPAALGRLDDRLFDPAYENADENAVDENVADEDAVAEHADAGDGRIDWSIRGGADAQGRPALIVSIEGSVPLQCQRCLGRLDLPVSQSTTVLLARDDDELVHLDDASEQEVVLANAPLDAVTLVEDELLLTLPFAPRHETPCEEAGAANER
jgi:uncharacterized protein